ncbi:hypothetical protein LMG27177_06839 [Paraburkholderia fynbosensis]|uniref:HTH araC/xylS-type domain-containing protein n=1 Tax=Paraburkholderia fynbosensis TaxID=1200993 RepID=A0A6J5GYY8_9BURK|nr:hypothetical protein LMG27177_06839 [Paraburkholderia fynbosensis]
MQTDSTYLRHTYSGFGPSQAFDVVSGGRFEHRLLSSKLANMVHQRLTLGDIVIETGCYDFPVIANGCMPRNSVCIGLMADGAEITRVNTASIHADEIQIYPRGAELLYHAAGTSRWINFNVPEGRLQKVATVRRGRPLKLPTRSAASVPLKRGGRAALALLVDDAMSLARSLEPDGMAPDLAREMSDAMVDAYASALCDAQIPTTASTSSTADRHHRLILACERLAMSSDETDLALVQVAERSGYSLRSLQLIFRRSVGMTPGRWFMNIRLNGALRDLLTPTEDCSVTDVARKWGFHHLSRFAYHYRTMFGELPSETLRRARP